MSDLILAVFLLLGVWYGWRRGLVKILAGPGAVIGGIFFARHLVGFAAPLVEAKLQNTVTIGSDSGNQWLSGLFFSSTFLGKAVELILFLLLVGLVVWLFRRLTKTAGDVVNSTPLVGFLCRLTGALLALLCMGVLLYALRQWAIPWLAQVSAGWAAVGDFLDNSVLVLPFVQWLGSFVLDMAAYGVAAFDFKTYG